MIIMLAVASVRFNIINSIHNFVQLSNDNQNNVYIYVFISWGLVMQLLFLKDKIFKKKNNFFFFFKYMLFIFIFLYLFYFLKKFFFLKITPPTYRLCYISLFIIILTYINILCVFYIRQPKTILMYMIQLAFFSKIFFISIYILFFFFLNLKKKILKILHIYALMLLVIYINTTYLFDIDLIHNNLTTVLFKVTDMLYICGHESVQHFNKKYDIDLTLVEINNLTPSTDSLKTIFNKETIIDRDHNQNNTHNTDQLKLIQLNTQSYYILFLFFLILFFFKKKKTIYM